MKIATITLNPAYDYVGSLDGIEIGEVNKVTPLGFYPAGKGINVAKVLANLGHTSTVTGFYGESNKKDFDDLFSTLRLMNHFYPVEGKTRTNIKLTEADGQVTDFNFAGFTVSAKDWQNFCKESLELLADYDVVAICGSLPQGVKPRELKHWILSLKENGKKIVFDSSHAALNAGVTAKPWLIKPNQRELEVLCGYRLYSEAEVLKAAQELHRDGIANVVVSLGEEGSIWVSDGIALRAYPPTVQVVSTVGAGDSMVAGFIHALIKGYSPKETLCFATAISSYAVTQENVGIKNIDDLSPLLEGIKIKDLSLGLVEEESF